ncbi:MAG TPA: class I SAM-dependent methyltransferase [Edaphocola sp.]|nr:class I SAM-dependent methyltransferase [Edaphocola sp.]
MQCRLCKESASVIAKDYLGYQKGVRFDIYQCKHCDTNFVLPTDFTEDIYQYIYANPEKTPGYNRYYYYAENVKNHSDPISFLSERESMYWAAYQTVKSFNDKEIQILEVGSGLGYLTYSLRKAGYKAHGIDISSNAVEAAKKNFGDYYIAADIFEFNKSNQKAYDLIILTEVIEHLEDPVNFIKCLLKMLKDNGKILITTPNKSVNIPSLPWMTELPPVHLWWFSEHSVKSLAAQLDCNYELLNFKEFNRNNFDKMRYTFYKGYEQSPILNEAGGLINPETWEEEKANNFKATLQHIYARVAELPILSSFLVRKEYPINKSSTLAFVLKK